jgi:ribonuclease BN (tRNA processing enzyme)
LARVGVPPEHVEAILLTHYHTDHTAGLAPLLFGWHVETSRSRPLLVAGPPGLRRVRDGLLAAFGSWVGEPGFDIEWRELSAPDSLTLDGGVRVEFREVRHSPALTCLGYRFVADERILTISGDTEDCPGLRELARGADLLLADAGYPDDAAVAGHLTPSQVAAVVRDANVKRLVLTHFAIGEHEVAILAEVRRLVGGDVQAARDGDRYEVK